MALDADAFRWESTSVRGFEQAFVHEGSATSGSQPLLLVHGWPETARIWWRVIGPLRDAGFEVVVPDLRGFGRSAVGPDGFHDVASHALDLHALMGSLGHDRYVCVGGDLGGPVIQDLALRHPDAVDRMVLFNSPLPYVRDAMQGMRTRPPVESSDYFIRQGTDPDGLAAELDTEGKRRRYIATFYGPRFWAHPGAFDGESVAFMTEPFGDGAKLRASFGAYESVFSEAARAEPPKIGVNERTETLILFGPSDHVIYPEFDRMAAVVFPNHVGPFLVRDCGHFLQWEAAGVLVSAIRAFCRDLLAQS